MRVANELPTATRTRTSAHSMRSWPRLGDLRVVGRPAPGRRIPLQHEVNFPPAPWSCRTSPRDDRFVDENTVVLVLVIVTALGFDFTNGFHDTANAMATSIATKALRPKAAVLLSGVLNLIGAFLSVEVALTVTNAVVKIQNSNGTPKAELLEGGGSALLLIVLAGLCG